MLNGKQRAGLRRLANTTPPIFQIGKGGIATTSYPRWSALETRELARYYPSHSELDTPRRATSCAPTGAERGQAIGKRFVPTGSQRK